MNAEPQRDVRMRGFKERSRVSEGLLWIAEHVRELGAERIPFVKALGRTLKDDVVASRDVPPFPKAAMDGYAVRAQDLPGRLHVVVELMAADAAREPLGPHQAARIMTGARLVEGADTVVMVEKTRLDGDHVIVETAQDPGTNVLQKGEEVSAQHVVLRARRTVRPQDLSMLATMGALEVVVVRQPRVRIIPTGSELVPATGQHAHPNQGPATIESNSFMLSALAERDGAKVEVFPIVPDIPELLERALCTPGADLIVVVGGSSVGKQDFAPPIVRKIGELAFHGFDMRPASPTGIGTIGDATVLLAPGFPAASMISWDVFGRVIVERMLGREPDWPYRRARVRLDRAHEKPVDRVEIQRFVFQSPRDDARPPTIRLLKASGALLSSITRADGFVVLDAGIQRFETDVELDACLYG